MAIFTRRHHQTPRRDHEGTGERADEGRTGQIWRLIARGRYGESGHEEVIKSVSDTCVDFDSGGCDELRDFGPDAEPDYRYEFVSWSPGFGPSPSPEGVGRVMEETKDEWGSPVACLVCGVRFPDGEHRWCHIECDPPKHRDLHTAWQNGARDFPRSPAPVPVAAKPAAVECTFTYGGQHCQMLNEHKDHICGADPGFRIPVAAAEREAAMVRPHDGTVSALQAIQSRPKPEPWVESCDPLHWLRDA